METKVEVDSGFAEIDKLTTIDFPGHLAAILFVEGCNLRCPYCHNKDIVCNKKLCLPYEIVQDFLRQREGQLDGVVLTGGEPLCNSGRVIKLLTWLSQEWRDDELPYSVKIDTNGMASSLRCLFDNLRLTYNHPYRISSHKSKMYIAMDLKAPMNKYHLFMANSKGESNTKMLDTLLGNIEYLSQALKSSPRYAHNVEFRTTVHKALLSPEDLQLMKFEYLVSLNCKQWYLQQFRPCDCFDNSLNDTPTYSDEELTDIAISLGALVRGVPDKLVEKAEAQYHDTYLLTDKVFKEWIGYVWEHPDNIKKVQGETNIAAMDAIFAPDLLAKARERFTTKPLSELYMWEMLMETRKDRLEKLKEHGVHNVQ